jgi:hypothetical protein
MVAGSFRPLNLVRPFLALLPDVPQADRRVPFKERFLYTAVTLFIFLVCCIFSRSGTLGCARKELGCAGREHSDLLLWQAIFSLCLDLRNELLLPLISVLSFLQGLIVRGSVSACGCPIVGRMISSARHWPLFDLSMPKSIRGVASHSLYLSLPDAHTTVSG